METNGDLNLTKSFTCGIFSVTKGLHNCKFNIYILLCRKEQDVPKKIFFFDIIELGLTF